MNAGNDSPKKVAHSKESQIVKEIDGTSKDEEDNSRGKQQRIKSIKVEITI